MVTNRTSVSIVGPLSGEYDESVYVIRRLSWKARSQGYCFPSLPSIKGCSDFFNYLPGFWIYELIKRCTGIYFLAVWKSNFAFGKIILLSSGIPRCVSCDIGEPLANLWLIRYTICRQQDKRKKENLEIFIALLKVSYQKEWK